MKNVDDLFRRQLEDHSLSPRPELWQQLEQQLDGKKGASIWRWRIAALLVLSGISYTAYRFALPNDRPATALQTPPTSTRSIPSTTPNAASANTNGSATQTPSPAKAEEPSGTTAITGQRAVRKKSQPAVREMKPTLVHTPPQFSEPTVVALADTVTNKPEEEVESEEPEMMYAHVEEPPASTQNVVLVYAIADPKVDTLQAPAKSKSWIQRLRDADFELPGPSELSHALVAKVDQWKKRK